MSNLDYKVDIIKSQELYLIKAEKRRNNKEFTRYQRIFFYVFFLKPSQYVLLYLFEIAKERWLDEYKTNPVRFCTGQYLKMFKNFFRDLVIKTHEILLESLSA